MEVDHPPKAIKKLKNSKLRKRMQTLSNLSPLAPPSGDQARAPANPLKQQILALRAQLNFYFGDSNLAKDKFLRTQLQKSPLVPLDLLKSFNRVREILAPLSPAQQQECLI